jgi:cytidylate kinase
LVERISSNAKSTVKIAHVASPKWVRSGKFAVTVAKNRGLDAENFQSAATALEWLLKTNESNQPNNPAFR